MQSDWLVILSFVAAVLTTALLFYGSYWALTIAKTRTSRLYRRQALSVGAIGVYFGLIWILSPFTNPLVNGNIFTFALSAVAFFAGVILIFGWIDSSVRLARRTDPLRRNTFNWPRVRIAFWIAIVADIIVLIVIYSRLSMTEQNISGPQNVGFLASILAIIVIGSPALVVAGRRSRDPTLRRNLVWFAVFIILVLVYIETGYLAFALGEPSGQGPTFALVSEIITAILALLPVIGAYSLYRSARSLAPIKPFPITDEVNSPKA